MTGTSMSSSTSSAERMRVFIMSLTTTMAIARNRPSPPARRASGSGRRHGGIDDVHGVNAHDLAGHLSSTFSQGVGDGRRLLGIGPAHAELDDTRSRGAFDRDVIFGKILEAKLLRNLLLDAA